MDWISNWKLELLVGQFAGAKRLKTILVRYQLISRKEDEEGAFSCYAFFGGLCGKEELEIRLKNSRK